MNYPVRTSSGIYVVSVETQLLGKREIHIYDEITSARAEEVAEAIHFLDLEDSDKPIRLFFHSPGGQTNAGMLIYDTCQLCHSPVYTYCTGFAYSMAAVLCIICGEKRYIFENSEMMLHRPYMHGDMKAENRELIQLSKRLETEEKRMFSLLSKHTGKPVEWLEKEISYDRYYTAEEALACGFVDEILKGVH